VDEISRLTANANGATVPGSSPAGGPWIRWSQLSGAWFALYNVVSAGQEVVYPEPGGLFTLNQMETAGQRDGLT
jgi:hypothetical protein